MIVPGNSTRPGEGDSIDFAEVSARITNATWINSASDAINNNPDPLDIFVTDEVAPESDVLLDFPTQVASYVVGIVTISGS